MTTFAAPVEIAYLLAGMLFIIGLRYLGSPKTARLGNRVAAGGMLIALVAVLLSSGFTSWLIIAVGLGLGALVGILSAQRVKMTAMPQMVAIFNGAGGGAAALVAIAEYLSRVATFDVPVDAGIAIAITSVVGALSFTGSIVAYLKLQELLSGKPLTFGGQQIINGLLALIILITALLTIVGGHHLHVGAQNSIIPFWVMIAAACALGVLFVLPIGGADMPVIISLLNSFTGLAAATTGFVLQNNVLIISGALVGASGTLLTLMMGKAMNRSLFSVLFGAFGAVRSSSSSGMQRESGGTVREASVDDVATMLAYARQVVIVPGYGMAVAQAQHSVRELSDRLEARGVIVKYAIHPVAGRMPGHMNVLLAEANVPYPALYDMEDINPEFARTDVALIIGANDVTNPAARSDRSSPIFGMPILDVDRAERVVVLKRSMKPGFAGIDNQLYEDPRCVMLFGDAKASVDALASAIKSV